MPKKKVSLPKRPKRAPKPADTSDKPYDIVACTTEAHDIFPKGTPILALKAPSRPSEPSKPLEAPPVAPPGQEAVRSAIGQSWPAVLDDAQFNVCWGQLSMRQKQKVRELAEVRGLGLRGVLNLFPGMRSG